MYIFVPVPPSNIDTWQPNRKLAVVTFYSQYYWVSVLKCLNPRNPTPNFTKVILGHNIGQSIIIIL